MYGALDYSNNYADNLDFSTNKNYTGEVTSYLENQGYINPSSVETNTTYNNMPYLDMETNLSAEVPEWLIDSILNFSAGLGNARISDVGLSNQTDTVLNASKIGGKTIGTLGYAFDAYDVYQSIIAGDVESICVQVGGVAFGTIGAILGSAAGAGWMSVVGGTMGAIAGEALGEMAGQWVYDTGKYVYENYII
ncbi:MAG: hypothetical protein R3Y32_09165 [Bacillota bacterium]